ncbi:MAG: hypothetical protein QGF74_00360 [Candidatus Nanoarchaeia archaeon]|jgi:hypothetical protein|nr:hypothetical protein [Candidatus Nanoarchaeia archaeon]|tara:strand:- start:49823 stop:50137 length:315 start_codon:yes stop_codon:yes gene_type:complete
MENITYVGLKKLDEDEIEVINKLTERFYPKINREFDSVNLTVDVKKYDPTGKRGKYSIHLRIDHPNIKNILSAKEFDWDLATSLHKTFDNLMSEIEHKFKDNKP